MSQTDTTGGSPSADYAHVARRLAKVRRAWKRTAALSGAALVLLESIGIVTLAVLVDVLYGHIAAVRIALFVAAIGAIAVLTVRHVVRPLLRPIGDEVLALYVEERNDAFEGALMTAAEYGPRGGQTPTQSRMVEAVLRRADVGAQRSRLSSVVSLARLRKYALAALILLGVYVVMCALFPEHVGRRVARLFQPWLPEARAAAEAGPGEQGLAGDRRRRRLPIDLRLSVGDVRIPRGADLAVEAALSRQTDAPVYLYIRSVVEGDAPGEWQRLEMHPLEKLHAYGWRLQSVSEDKELYVSAETYRSDAACITVYDKLEIQGVEVTTRYPSYLELPQRFVPLSSGDVSAPSGSKITLRLLVNTKLASARLLWEGGREQAMQIDPQRPRTAHASFELRTSGRYRIAATDIDDQTVVSAGPAEVIALKDRPPTLELLQPTEEVETHPLGEVTYRAKASDDYGVARMDLVYVRFGEGAPREGREPLMLLRRANEEIPLPEVVDGELRLLLERMSPPLRPGEVISWHVEARDRKPDNPPGASDLHMIVVLPFEMWSAYGYEAGHPPGPAMEQMGSLQEILTLTWDLHRERHELAKERYYTRCEQIADKMVKPDTDELLTFMKVLPGASARVREIAGRVQQCAGQARKALLKFDTAEALKHLQRGVALIASAGVMEIEELRKEGPAPEGGMQAGGGAQAREQGRLTEMFAALKVELQRKLGAKVEGALERSKAAGEAAQAVAGVRRQQGQVVKRAQGVAKSAAGADRKGAQLRGLGKQERGLAQAAKAVASSVRRGEGSQAMRGAADKIGQAASAMQGVAGDIESGRVGRAERKAAEVDKLLADAENRLREARHDELAVGLAEAERMLEVLLRDQIDLRKDTDKLDRRMKGSASADATPGEKREAKRLAFRQVRLKAEFETFGRKMDQLRGWADSSRHTTAARAIRDAHRTLKRSRPGQKMANAIVELGDHAADAAAREQTAAAEAMAKILAQLQAASDALAATREEALKRAVRGAKQIRKGIEQIAMGKPGGEGGKAGGEGGKAAGEGGKAGGEGGKAGGEGGKAGGEGGKAGGEGGKAGGEGGRAGGEGGKAGGEGGKAGGEGGKAGGEGGKAGGEGGRAGGEGGKAGGEGGKAGGEGGKAGGEGGKAGGEGGKAGGEGGKAGGEGGKAGGEGGRGGPAGPGIGGRRRTAGDTRRLGRQIATDVRRLDRQLKTRDFGLGQDARSLTRVARDPALEDKLIADPVAQGKLGKLVARLQDRLEAELASTAKAKRMLAAQRELCPPRYRHLVSKYYEALSRERR